MARQFSRNRFALLGNIPTGLGYYVYKFWSGETLLYVGRVGNSGPQSMLKRLTHHAYSKSWWPEVTRVEVETFGSHEEIVAAEQRLVRELAPLHNRAYSKFCPNGHDKSVTGVYESGQCRACCIERALEQVATPEARERERGRQRQRELSGQRRAYYRQRDARRAVMGTRRTPGAGQGALF